MNDYKTINFPEERDFSAIIGAAVNFVNYEIQNLGKLLLLYVFPMFALVQILSYSLGVHEAQALQYNNFEAYPRVLFVNVVNFIVYILFYSLIISYIKLYITKGKDSFDLKEVFNHALSFFYKLSGAQLLFGLITLLGFALLVIPAVYIAVVSLFVHVVVIFENKSGMSAVSRCFEIIKNRWWQTFGFIILVLISFIFIASLFTILFKFLNIDFNSSSALVIFSQAIMISFSIILITYLEIIIVLLYFSYVEKSDYPSLINKINEIAVDNDSENRFEEIDTNDNQYPKSEDKPYIEPDDNIDRYKPKY